MTDRVDLLKEIYAAFNARDIDTVLARLDADVLWANGMEGGHVRGHQALRDYWTAQWAVVSPEVTPERFDEQPDGSVIVAVRQVVRDLEGEVLDESHGLPNKLVRHSFHFTDRKVSRFDIQDGALS